MLAATDSLDRLKEELGVALGADHVIDSEAVRAQHSMGESFHNAGLPDVVVHPGSTEDVVAVVQLCRAFVGGDSGPVHIAVAVGTPTIGIFGRNEPERFFPYPESAGHRAVYARVWCSPCHRDECDHLSCLRAISPDWAWDVLERALARADENAGGVAGPAAGPVPTHVLGAPVKSSALPSTAAPAPPTP